jgi:malonyl-CoA/methylmalonyl-CoA synthetase
MSAPRVRMTYAELATRVDEIAAFVVASSSSGAGGLGGAPVGFLAGPGPGHLATLLGILRAGGLAVPLSPLHTRLELEYQVANAAPATLLATAGQRATLEAAAGGRRVESLEEAAAGAGGPLPPPPGAGDPAIMLYTSGTTGRPKGVRLSHAAVAATVASLETAWRWRSDDRLLHVLPLHHTHGLIVAALGALWAGAEARFVPFEAAAVWEALADGITVFMAVPTIYAKLMEAYRAADPERRARWAAGAARLRLFTSGSAALPASLLEAFRAATGQTILERYGMTEIGMALSNPYDEVGARVPGAVGTPLPGVEVDIVRDDGPPAPDGEPGELRVRSTQMFSGYHGDPAATAASFDEAGRFRTGDTGVRDGAGVVRLLGRTSVDIIKSGGYKISALEIEAALRDHPAVAEVAVIGEPDETWGEQIAACIVARAGASLSLDELQAFARERLAVYKVPRALRLLPELPRNAMGKVMKKQLLP